MKILVLNGVNMNMLGMRKAEFYGVVTLAELQKHIADFAAGLGVETEFAQSNGEGALVDILQQTDADGVVFNAGAYSHYSYALRDCVEDLPVPVVEVHMSNIYLREDFRRIDVLADVCEARFYGNGEQSYLDAVEYLCRKLEK